MNIKELRRKKGLSLRELAEIIGVKHTAVQGWESRGVRPHPKYMPKIAAALGVSVEELFGGGETLPARNQSLADKLIPAAKAIGIPADVLLSAYVDALANAFAKTGVPILPAELASLCTDKHTQRAYAQELPPHMRKGSERRSA